MNQAQWHLQLNHLPIIGIIIGCGVLIAGFIFKNTSVKRTALGIFIFSAIMDVPAFLTGEGAEDAAENLAGANKALIEKHEELAAFFTWMAGALGLVALITFIVDLLRLKAHQFLYITTFIVSVGCIALAKQVGTAGGQIRHTEIRGANAQNIPVEGLPQEAEENDD